MGDKMKAGNKNVVRSFFVTIGSNAHKGNCRHRINGMDIWSNGIIQKE
jgi:hypothetical protein